MRFIINMSQYCPPFPLPSKIKGKKEKGKSAKGTIQFYIKLYKHETSHSLKRLFF